MLTLTTSPSLFGLDSTSSIAPCSPLFFKDPYLFMFIFFCGWQDEMSPSILFLAAFALFSRKNSEKCFRISQAFPQVASFVKQSAHRMRTFNLCAPWYMSNKSSRAGVQCNFVSIFNGLLWILVDPSTNLFNWQTMKTRWMFTESGSFSLYTRDLVFWNLEWPTKLISQFNEQLPTRQVLLVWSDFRNTMSLIKNLTSWCLLSACNFIYACARINWVFSLSRMRSHS